MMETWWVAGEGLRRLTRALVFVTRLPTGGDLLDGCTDAEVGRAPAQVSTHRFVDVGVGWVRIAVQERHGLHDLAGLAVTAPGHVVVDPGLLDGVQLATLGQAVDRRDVLALDGADRCDARTPRLAVDVAGACAAEAHTAAVLEAVNVEAVTKNPEELLVVVGVDRDRVAVECEGDVGRGNQAAYSLSGKLRGCLPVARAQALAAAAVAAGVPTSPIPPGGVIALGRMCTLASSGVSNIRVHLKLWKFDSRVAPLSMWRPDWNTVANPSKAWPSIWFSTLEGFTQ